MGDRARAVRRDPVTRRPAGAGAGPARGVRLRAGKALRARCGMGSGRSPALGLSARPPARGLIAHEATRKGPANHAGTEPEHGVRFEINARF